MVRLSRCPDSDGITRAGSVPDTGARCCGVAPEAAQRRARLPSRAPTAQPMPQGVAHVRRPRSSWLAHASWRAIRRSWGGRRSTVLTPAAMTGARSTFFGTPCFLNPRSGRGRQNRCNLDWPETQAAKMSVNARHVTTRALCPPCARSSELRGHAARRAPCRHDLDDSCCVVELVIKVTRGPCHQHAANLSPSQPKGDRK